MGQHKHNPMAQAAKRGELPPKKPKLSKRKAEALIYDKLVKECLPTIMFPTGCLADDFELKERTP